MRWARCKRTVNRFIVSHALARNNCALKATTTVLKPISTAPTAGLKTIPQGYKIPAAKGSAMALYQHYTENRLTL